MNTIEEKLWNYIDGSCSEDEQKAISALIAGNETYRIKYNELLKLNKEFSAMELDEPSMAFTCNVMEAIRTEQAQPPLKAAINKRIIMGITIFFVLTIAILLGFVLANIHLSAINVAVPAGLKMPEMKTYFTKPVIEGFLFFDAVLALYLFDTFLRRKGQTKQI
jgi:sterol desaturase/sphingolipid hydroxylase (fatty acid hydroxylase superfamily)